MSVTLVSKEPIHHKSAEIEVMAWRRQKPTGTWAKDVPDQ